MRLQHLFSVGLLGLGLAMAPAFTPTLRAADEPAKEAPKEGEKHHHGSPLEHYRALLGKLNLSEDQKTKIDAAFSDAKTKIDSEMKDVDKSDKKAVKAKIKPIMDNLHETVDGILTPEQKEEIKKEREAHEHHQKPGDAPAAK